MSDQCDKRFHLSFHTISPILHRYLGEWDGDIEDLSNIVAEAVADDFDYRFKWQSLPEEDG